VCGIIAHLFLQGMCGIIGHKFLQDMCGIVGPWFRQGIFRIVFHFITQHTKEFINGKSQYLLHKLFIFML
jgi:hypothetical protein